ncbi:MAG: S8 family serine peptidase, partial [Proteobacteria bacterium]|nr:S8 family serine peptidase [Pseudomonadota bacterium]
VAGVIAAQANNDGVVGIAPGAKIMAIRIFGNSDQGFSSVAAEAITYAADHGANVVNASWTYGRRKSRIVTNAIEDLRSEGGVFVTSAGNEPLDYDVGGIYPGMTDLDNVITVAASNRHDELTYFPGLWASAFGNETVELTAPGDGILTLENDGATMDFSGTSAAAPVVTATVALLFSMEPELEPTEVSEILVGSTDNNGSATISSGRLNAGNALRLALTNEPPLSLTISGPAEPLLSQPTRFTVKGPEAEYTWYFPDDDTFASGKSVQHLFTAPGNWEIVAEGIAADGARGRASRSVDLPIDWFSTEVSPVESEHIDGEFTNTIEITTDETAIWTRLHFAKIDFRSDSWEESDAYAVLVDEEAMVVWSFEGTAEDIWTPPLRGNNFTLGWYAANNTLDQPSWGLSMDEVEVWDPTRIPPEPEGPTHPTKMSDFHLQGGPSCSATGRVWSHPFLCLIVLLIRRRKILDFPKKETS